MNIIRRFGVVNRLSDDYRSDFVEMNSFSAMTRLCIVDVPEWSYLQSLSGGDWSTRIGISSDNIFRLSMCTALLSQNLRVP